MTIRAFYSRGGFSIQDPPIQVINNVGNYNGGTGTFSGAVTAPSFIGSIAASSITGTTLSSNVVLSSLTSLGTITSGVWNGTAIGDTYISSAATWNTASTDRFKWDGGATGLVAATGRTSLGLDIGINVQAYNTTLANVAAGTYTGSSSITTLGTLPTLAISTTGTTHKTAAINMAQGVTASSSVTSEINLYSYTADELSSPPVPITTGGTISSHTAGGYDLRISGAGDTGYITILNNVLSMGDVYANLEGGTISLDGDTGIIEISAQTTNFYGSVGFNDPITTYSTVTVGDFVTIGSGLGLVDCRSTTLTTTTANQTIYTLSKIVYRSAEFFIQASTAGGAYEALKIVVLHDGTNTWNTQYGVVRSGASLGTYTTITTVIGGGSFRLRVTPTTVNTTYKVMITALPV